MFRHHLPLANVIIVNEGHSTDGTYEAIRDLDPKIKVFRSDWGKPNGSVERITRIKDDARRRCTGHWCLQLDCAEFIPEWDFARLRTRLESARQDLLPVRMINFYGNYKVFHAHPEKVPWPSWKMSLHRNRPDVEVRGDGNHVRIQGQPFDNTPAGDFTIHHFGFVRHPAWLRQKWNLLSSLYGSNRRWLPLPSFLLNLLPHNWKAPDFLDDLQIYEGPSIEAVRNDPKEFTRDGMSLRRYLTKIGRRPQPVPFS